MTRANTSVTPPTTGDAAYRRRWWTFAVLCFSLLVVGLDNSILNVALPTLVRDLAASASQVQWMVDAYVLVFAGLLLTTGSLGDRFGRKRALVVGLLIFGGGSVGAAFSGTAEHLILFRALMGLGAAFIMPSTLSITTNTFTDERERGRAVGTWAGIAGIGVVLGPLTGGWLLQRFPWGSVFLINVPFILVTLAAGLALVPESKDPNASPLDPFGALLSITGLAALLYGIIEQPTYGWADTSVRVAFGAALVLLSTFIVWELRSAHPMLDMRLFRNPRFSAASGALTLLAFALFGGLFFLTQLMQFVLGYTPLETGVRVIPLALALMVCAQLGARLAERLGTRSAVATGMLIIAGGLVLLATLNVTSGYGSMALTLVVLGAGMGIAAAPATNSVMSALPAARAGVGSAVNDTTRQVGGALGVALLGSIFSSGYTASMRDAVGGLPGPLAAAASDSIGKAIAVAQRLPGPLGAHLLTAAHAAFLDGMDRAVLVAAATALLGALVAALFLPAKARTAVAATDTEAATAEVTAAGDVEHADVEAAAPVASEPVPQAV